MLKLVLHLLIAVLLLSGLASGQSDKPSPSDAETKPSSLELPSLSIFGFSPSTAPDDFDKPFSPAELDKFLAEVKKSEAEYKRSSKNKPYWIIPMVFFKSRHLFSKGAWTFQEMEQGRQISRFFAELTGMPSLEIKASEQGAFRQGLVRLRDWFASMCQDNTTLASMIFTLDDGPFFGADIDIKEFPRMRLVESAAIPGKQARFVLMTDGSNPEPMVIGVLNEDKSVRWLKRFSNGPKGRITEAELKKPALYKVEGYGYAVALMTDGTFGRERSHVYLDDALNLRFYYVSW